MTGIRFHGGKRIEFKQPVGRPRYQLASVRVFDTAVTQLYWAFALLVAWIIERIREVFETKANILANARRKIFRKGRVEENRRVRSLLKKHRVEVPPAVVDELSKVPSGNLEDFRDE